MKYSVIIPCYNVERWLGRCIDSVASAMPEGGELIAINDGSADGTGALLRGLRDSLAGTFAASGRRFSALSIPHAGVSAARNAGLGAAEGEIVFFVDPDDEVEPDFFSKMIAAMERDVADCCICAFKTRRDGDAAAPREDALKADYSFASNGDIVEKFLPRIFGYSFGDIRRWYGGECLFSGREMASACRMAYRRRVIERHSIRFDESVELYEDMLFNARFLLHAERMSCVREALYRVTERASGAMASVPRDGTRYCRNKLRLLAARGELDAESGGRLASVYAGTCVLSALELLSFAVRLRVPPRDGAAFLRECLSMPAVRRALRGFPLSPRRPFVAAAVLILRAASAFVRR